MQFGRDLWQRTASYLPCLHVYCEDAVRTGGGLVHGRLADGAVGVPQEELRDTISKDTPVKGLHRPEQFG